VLVIAATNKPESLDKALVRPGRFDRRVFMGLPDIRGREAILKIHSRDKMLGNDIDVAKLAAATPGFSGADIENLLNEAALRAARQRKPTIDMADIEWARDEVTQGPARKTMVISAKEKWLTAVHEAGHTVVAHFTAECDPVHRVTIIPRNESLGTTQFLPTEDRLCLPKSHLLGMLKSALGGRLAEESFFGGDVTTGAASDLVHATNIAKRMVFDFGMGEGLGMRSYGEKEQDYVEQTFRRDFSDETARRLDEGVDAIISGCRTSAKQVIEDKRDLIEALAQELIKRETLESADLLVILGPRPTR
jgi:cell division protease FtsH